MSNSQKMIQLRLGFLLAVIAIASSACRSNAPEMLPPEQIIQRTAGHMQNLPGFHFVIERNGAPAYLDISETIVFRRAEGDYVAGLLKLRKEF